jgi:hypothetical protein
VIRAFIARLLPHLWWLGRAHTATIAPAPSGGGYMLKILHSQSCEWVPLPPRTWVYDRPDEREFSAASTALAARGLTWVLPWGLDTDGNLTAPVEPLSPEDHP